MEITIITAVPCKHLEINTLMPDQYSFASARLVSKLVLAKFCLVLSCSIKLTEYRHMDLGWHLFLCQLVHYHAHITRSIRPHHSQDMQDFHCDYCMCESAICQWLIFDILLTDKLTDDGQNQLLNPCAQYTLMQIAAPIFQSPQHSWWGLVLAKMRLVQWVTWFNI